jgi:dolichyl-diphosphooligosaccharide--protein glycosyltransferase
LLTNLKPLLDTPNKVQETTRGSVVGARQAAEVRIFEAVPGALLEGSGRPGAPVVASLKLSAPTTHRRWTTTWSSTVGPDGKFSLRVPYSTLQPLNADPNTVKVRGPYEMTVDGKMSQIPVSEEDVQKGQKVVVP